MEESYWEFEGGKFLKACLYMFEMTWTSSPFLIFFVIPFIAYAKLFDLIWEASIVFLEL